MKRYKLILFLLLAFSSILAACDSGTSTTGSIVSCIGRFDASVDQSIVVEGDLRIDVDETGRMTGMIKPASGSDISVVGEVDGQAISLAIPLDNDQYIFGTGAFTQAVSACAGVAGGTFAVETINGASSTGRLSLQAAPVQQPPAQAKIENGRIGIWGYALGGSP